MSEPTDLQFEHEGDVLVVRVNGRYIIEKTEVALKRVAEAIERQPVKATLIDLRGVTGNIAFMDRYKLGKLAGNHLRRVPICVLAREDQLDRERIGLVVAKNRGVNVEVFSDLPAAQNWLERIPPSGITPTVV